MCKWQAQARIMMLGCKGGCRPCSNIGNEQKKWCRLVGGCKAAKCAPLGTTTGTLEDRVCLFRELCFLLARGLGGNDGVVYGVVFLALLRDVCNKGGNNEKVWKPRFSHQIFSRALFFLFLF